MTQTTGGFFAESHVVIHRDLQIPADGTGVISVRPLGSPEDHAMEAHWTDRGKTLSVSGTALGVLKWAFYMPSAETRLYDGGEFVALDQAEYDALAM